MNKQQTSVEWLVEQVEQISNNKNLLKQEYIDLYNKAIEQAKQLEKQQIIDAYETGIWDVGCRAADSEQYYQETFNK